MITLYLDTTSSFLYAGIVKNDILIEEIKKEYGKDLSSNALSDVEKMIINNKLDPNDIDKIIVVNGPGSFTGIRIGITIAKTFAWALKKDIITISSLDAMAVSLDTDLYKVPIIDARRDCSYFGIYDSNNEIVVSNEYCSNEKIKEYLNKLDSDYVIITNDSNFESNNKEKYDPNILKIVKKYYSKETINPHSVNPIYLKLTEAEEKQNGRD